MGGGVGVAEGVLGDGLVEVRGGGEARSVSLQPVSAAARLRTRAAVATDPAQGRWGGDISTPEDEKVFSLR